MWFLFFEWRDDSVVEVANDIQLDTLSLRDVTHHVPVSVKSVEFVNRPSLSVHSVLAGKTVTFEDGNETVSGTFSHNNGNLHFINVDKHLHVYNSNFMKTLTVLEEKGFGNAPYLTITAENPPEGVVRLRYNTKNLTWSPHYVFTIIDEATAMINAWIYLENKTNVPFDNCSLNLIETVTVRKRKPKTNTTLSLFSNFSTSNTNSVHGRTSTRCYSVRDISLPTGSSSVPLFAPRDIPATILYIYQFPKNLEFPNTPYTTEREAVNFNNQSAVRKYLRFVNNEENNLGIDFPKGNGIIINDNETIDQQTKTCEVSDVVDGNEALILMSGSQLATVTREVRKFAVNQQERTMEEIIYFSIVNDTVDQYDLEIRCPVYRTESWTVPKVKHCDARQVENEVFVTVTVNPQTTTKCSLGIQYQWEEEPLDERVETGSKSARGSKKSFFSTFFS